MPKRYSIPKLKEIQHDSDLTLLIKNEVDFLNYFHQTEEEVKGSQFICTLFHCTSIEAARLGIDFIQRKYKDATHNCWAFQVCEPKSTKHIGYSDDGEPHGTAGKPMLTQLLYTDIGELAAVVTRYFGGTKLGTGGLVRAYSNSVALALENLPLLQKMPKIRLEIIIDYKDVGFIHRMLDEYEIKIEGESHGADITFNLLLPKDRFDDFLTQIQALTNGTYLILSQKEEF